MPARNSQPVRYLIDDTSVPPRRYEAVTRTPNALAFRHCATFDPAMPDHSFEGSVLTATWSVIQHYAPADAEPTFVYYDRAEPQRFEVCGQRYAQLGDAMEAAICPPS